MPPPSSNVCVAQGVQGLVQVLLLGIQVRQDLFIGGESLVVLQVMHHTQGCIQGLQHLGSLGGAAPLPPCMDPLRIQDMVWGQQEPRCQEFEQTFKLPMVVPQEGWAVCF